MHKEQNPSFKKFLHRILCTELFVQITYTTNIKHNGKNGKVMVDIKNQK